MIKPGSLVAFSSGEFSDYRVGSFAKVLKSINRAVWQAMIDACTKAPDYDPDGDPRFDEYAAVPWLITNGYIEEIDYTELHLGDYGRCPPWAESGGGSDEEPEPRDER